MMIQFWYPSLIAWGNIFFCMYWFLVFWILMFHIGTFHTCSIHERFIHEYGIMYSIKRNRTAGVLNEHYLNNASLLILQMVKKNGNYRYWMKNHLKIRVCYIWLKYDYIPSVTVSSSILLFIIYLYLSFFFADAIYLTKNQAGELMTLHSLIMEVVLINLIN